MSMLPLLYVLISLSPYLSFHPFLLSSPSLCYPSAVSPLPFLVVLLYFSHLSFLLSAFCFLLSFFSFSLSLFLSFSLSLFLSFSLSLFLSFSLSLSLFLSFSSTLYIYIKRHHLICKKVVLRDYEEQKKLNRTSYDLVTKDGKVLPKPGPNFEGIQSLSSLLLLCLPPLKEG